jgi:hypothetical protein
VKKLIIVLLLPFFSCAQGGYIEFNGGIARLGSNYYDIELGPGASALIGKQFDVTNTPFLFDMQIGLAFPSLLTAKVGVGSLLYRKTGTALTFGVRPWPLHLYTQLQLFQTDIIGLFVSFEAGSKLLEERGVSGGVGNLDYGDLSMNSRFMINIGYRLDLEGLGGLLNSRRSSFLGPRNKHYKP